MKFGTDLTSVFTILVILVVFWLVNWVNARLVKAHNIWGVLIFNVIALAIVLAIVGVIQVGANYHIVGPSIQPGR